MSNHEDEEYEVEKIIDKKYENGKATYLVKWAGWPESESTWEPQENLGNSKLLIKKFEKPRQLPKKSNKQIVSQTLFLSEDKSNDINSGIFYTRKKSEVKKVSNKYQNSNLLLHKKRNGKLKGGLLKIPKTRKIYERDTTESISKDNETTTASSSLFTCELPKRIISAYQDKTCEEVMYLIEWNPSKEGRAIPNSGLTSTELRLIKPYLMIRYLESKLKFT